MSLNNKVKKTIRTALRIDDNVEILDINTLNELGANPIDMNEVIMSIEELLDIDDIEPLIKIEWTVLTKVSEILEFVETV